MLRNSGKHGGRRVVDRRLRPALTRPGSPSLSGHTPGPTSGNDAGSAAAPSTRAGLHRAGVHRSVSAPGSRHRASAPRRPGRNNRPVFFAVLFTVVSVFLGSGTGWGYWTAQALGSGTASTGTLTAPADVTATGVAESNLVDVSWTASSVVGGDPEGGYYLTRVRESDNSKAPACDTSPSDLTSDVACQDEPLVRGDYHYLVTAIHHSWTAESSASNTVNVNVPDAPSAPLLTTESDTGSSSTDGVTNAEPPTFTGTAEAGTTVTLYSGSTPVGSGEAVGGTYTITTSILSDGEQIITATATDGVGTGAESPDTTITVDTVRPSVTVDQDAGQADPTNTQPVVFTISFSESVTGFTEEDLTLVAPEGATAVVDGSGDAYTVSVSGMAADGTVTISLGADVVFDLAGNGNTDSTSTDGSVTRDTTPPVAPSTPDLAETSDSGSSSVDNVTNVTTPAVTGTAEDGSTVTLFSGSTPVGSGVATGGTYAITTGALLEGPHSITARATDAAGNVGLSSDGLTVTIDITAPDPGPSTPDLHTDSDSFSSSYSGDGVSTNEDDYTKVKTPLFTGTTEPGVTVTLYRDGTTFIGQGTADSGGTYSIQLQLEQALAHGVHSITATATDVAGNTAASPSGLTVTVDTVAPAVTIDTANSSKRTVPLVADYYKANFAGGFGVDTYDGQFTVLLCTTSACTTLVPGPATATGDSTWSRSSDEVYNCTLPVLGGGVCSGINPVYAQASQVDRAGNSTLVTGSVTFP